MDEFARRNLKDFLSMYNQFTELCFNHCIQNLNYREMIPEEKACANRCAEKLVNVNHRLITTYMEINPLHKQAAALEAAQAKASPDAVGKPLNLASQVQGVFGPDTVVTNGSAVAVPSVDGTWPVSGQGGQTQAAGEDEASAHSRGDTDVNVIE